jgi:hypothetical protein
LRTLFKLESCILKLIGTTGKPDPEVCH